MTKHETLSKSKGAGTRQVRSFVVGCVGRGKTCISALVYVCNVLGAIVAVFPRRAQQQCLGGNDTHVVHVASFSRCNAVETTMLGALILSAKPKPDDSKPRARAAAGPCCMVGFLAAPLEELEYCHVMTRVQAGLRAPFCNELGDCVFLHVCTTADNSLISVTQDVARGLKQLHSVMGAILEIDDAGNLAVVNKPLACRLYP